LTSFDVGRAQRRLKPGKWTQLPTLPAPGILVATCIGLARTLVLPDTTTYIHSGKKKLPPHAVQWLKWPVRHSSVALGEVAYPLGRLDPADSRTPARIAYLEEMLAEILPNRIIAPDEDMHLQAGIIMGIIARLKALPAGDHKKHLNDVLIAMTADKIGATVITANVADFMLIQQIVPTLKVAGYRVL